MATINIESLKKLTTIAPSKMVHLCKVSARLCGKLALREQFNTEQSLGVCSSLAMAEVDEDQLKGAIIKSARDCADTLFRLNILAKKNGIQEPLKEVSELDLSGIIEAVSAYVTALVGDSDYREWVSDYEN